MVAKQRFMFDTNVVCVLLEREASQLLFRPRFACMASSVFSGQRASLMSDFSEVLLIEAFDTQVASTCGLLRAKLQLLG